MKKIFALIMTVFMMFFAVSIFAGCETEDDCDVVCTVFPQYDFCRKIAGDELTVKMLLPAGTDAHNYMLTTKDKSAIKNSKLFVYIGGESENWVKDVIKSTDLSHTALLNLSEKVELIYPNEDHDHEGHEHEEYFDEHFWLSIKNGIALCNEICAEMTKAFPEKAETLNRNCQVYTSELSALETRYAEELVEVKNNTMFFADRFPFAYLASDYGLNCRSLMHGCTTDTDITPVELIKFKEEYKQSGATGVFVLESGDSSIAESIVNECGGKIYRLNSCQTVTKNDLQSGRGYLEIMTGNLETIKEGLK